MVTAAYDAADEICKRRGPGPRRHPPPLAGAGTDGALHGAPPPRRHPQLSGAGMGLAERERRGLRPRRHPPSLAGRERRGESCKRRGPGPRRHPPMSAGRRRGPHHLSGLGSGSHGVIIPDAAALVTIATLFAMHRASARSCTSSSPRRCVGVRPGTTLPASVCSFTVQIHTNLSKTLISQNFVGHKSSISQRGCSSLT
jgi:hypothetical protein